MRLNVLPPKSRNTPLKNKIITTITLIPGIMKQLIIPIVIRSLKMTITRPVTKYPVLVGVLCGLLIISGCASTADTKKQAPEKPSWMDTRPVSSLYYYGIGSVLKKGAPDRYKNLARENALSEMAGQINTQISSNMTLYKVEDRFGVREMLQNRIKTESKEFLEGYEFMGQWEDETRYYTIYRLSKSVFEQNKEARKTKAIEGALLKYQQAINHLHGNNYVMAYSLFVQTLEGIKDYLQEGVVTTSPQGYQIDLGGGTLSYLDEILKSLRIEASPAYMTITGEAPEKNIVFLVTNTHKNPIGEIPVKFSYSGGFLLTDTGKSDEKGQLESPDFKAPINSARETLTAIIDVQALARMATYDLDIRRMLEKWTSTSCKVPIEFVR
jgi:hypothetical protein